MSPTKPTTVNVYLKKIRPAIETKYKTKDKNNYKNCAKNKKTDASDMVKHSL